jgi:ABC-type uncharacterized transport system substrate-binding protein
MAVLAAEQKCRCFRFWAILNALNFIYSGPPTGLTIERGYGPFGPGDVHAAAGICRASRLLGCAAAWPLAVRAQQAAKLPTIGLIGPSTASADRTRRAAFAKRLGELGWVEGRSIAIECRWAEGVVARAGEIAAEYAQQKVDVIVVSGDAQVLAAKRATTVIPIVITASADPVGNGLVESLARPGGNVTGLSRQAARNLA